MLILARKVDEAIMIGDHIKITVVDIKGGKVRLGITAPRDIPVHRQEVWEKTQKEAAEAKQAEPPVKKRRAG